MKPIIYVSIDANGGTHAVQVTPPTNPPTNPPAGDLAWITYAPASSSLASALEENSKLKARNSELRKEVRHHDTQAAMRAQERSEGMPS